MNRPTLIVILLLFTSLFAQSQNGYLFVKKGYKKKKIYGEGDRIYLQTNDGAIRTGILTLLRNDTLWLTGQPIPRKNVIAVLPKYKQKKKFHIDATTLLLITAGAALTTGGLMLNKQADFKEAATAGIAIGFTPIAGQFLLSKMSFRRKKYKIGKKYHLQVLDFHLPQRRPF